jgi:hypothetical protein
MQALFQAFWLGRRTLMGFVPQKHDAARTAAVPCRPGKGHAKRRLYRVQTLRALHRKRRAAMA